MGSTITLRLGEWTPDRNPIGNGPNLLTADDCYPVSDGYVAYPGLESSVTAGTLNAACVGAEYGRRRNDGTPFIVAATASKLYVTDSSGVLTDRTGTWSLGTTSTASFAQYGSKVYAASIEQIIQAHELSGTSNFASLSTDAPAARYIAMIGHFLMAGNIVGQGTNASAIGTMRDGVQWAAFKNPASWPTVATDAAKAVLSDFRVMPGSGGDVQGVTGGRDFGLILQERQVMRATITGGDQFFSFTPIDTQQGCDIPTSVVQAGSITFYHSQSGWMACNGETVQRIGHGRVDEAFWSDLDTSATHLVSAEVDPNAPLVMFAYPGDGHPTGACNRLLVYNYALDRWSRITSSSVERILAVQQVGANVDTPISADIDGSPFDVDAVNYDGQPPIMAAFVPTTHALKTFSGNVSPMRLVCGDFEASPGRRSFVRRVRPHVTLGGSAALRVGARNRPGDAATFGGWGVADATSGSVGARSAGRYHRFELYAFGDIGTVSGFDADVEPEGMR